MKDSLPINNDPLGHAPRSKKKLLLECLDLVVDAFPSMPFLNQAFEFQPLPEGHFDGIAGTSGMKEFEDGSHEKGRIHAEIQPIVFPEGLLNLPEDISQEWDRGLSVMDVSRAVLHSQDMAGLGETGSDGIIAGDFPVMWVESSKGSFHLQSGGDHRSVYIDCKGAKRKKMNHSGDEFGIDPPKHLERTAGEVFQPSAERSCAGQLLQSTKSLEKNIPFEKIYVLQPATTYHEESQEKADNGYDAVISSNKKTCEVATNEFVEVDGAKIADQEFEACVGGEIRFCELDSKFSLDSVAQIGFSISHSMRPFVWVESLR
jgi:hypothetical protein